MAFTGANKEFDEDALLVEQCLAGNQKAWAKLVTKHYGAIASVVRSVNWGFGPSDREDLMQEVLEELVKSLPNYEHQARLKGFIQTLTFRQCTEHLKRVLATKRTTDRNCDQVDTVGGEREHTGGHIPADHGSDPLSGLLEKERIGALRGALQRLDTECKKLVRMRFFEELSFPDMAGALSLKENTVAVKLGRCVQKLRPFLNS